MAAGGHFDYLRVGIADGLALLGGAAAENMDQHVFVRAWGGWRLGAGLPGRAWLGRG